MSDLDRLLRRVLEDPRSDAARLAYADALGDADPRARFIKIQLAVAGRAFEGAEAWQSERRERDLLRQHRAAFAGGIPDLVDEYWFERGFVEAVALPASQFLAHADELFAEAPILDLTLTGAVAVSARLFASPHLARLRSLNLASNDLGDEEAGVLAASRHLAGLRWLDLSGNHIGAPGLEALAASPHLTTLRWLGFADNDVDDPTPKPIDDFGTPLGSEVPALAGELQQRHGERPWLQPPGAWSPDPATM